MWTRTKIICTMGPSVNTKEGIRELIHAGMNVARLNFSHGTHEEHARVIEMLKEVRDELKVPLAIMLDTKGPEIRIGKIRGGECYLKPGLKWQLIKEEVEGDESQVSIKPPHVLDRFQEGMTVLFDNGYISSQVVEINEKGAVVQIHESGTIKSGKGVNVPDVDLELPVISDRDVVDIKFGCQMDVDIIAASFVRSPEHVIAVKELLKEQQKSDIWVIAKIENRQGVDNLDSILHVADGILVARGDLGVEVPQTQVPKLQKMMIRKCCMTGKPAGTATHMLESMITNPRPTRAETSDVANAVYDSTSAIMLSAETAVGKYPIDSVKVMKSIAHAAEEDFPYRQFFEQHADLVYKDVPSAVTLATVKSAYSLAAKAIFTFTESGATARLVSRLRPEMPIVAMTPRKKSFHQLAFIWGVIPFFSEEYGTVQEAFSVLSTFSLDHHLVGHGDLVVLTAGQPFGIAGTTNTMMVESIGDVLVRGSTGWGHQIHGKVSLALHPLKESYLVRGQILVITVCDEEYEPLIREAAAVILENHPDDMKSERTLLHLAKMWDKPVILQGRDATHILKEGQLVTLDPDKAIVYKGITQE